MSLGMICLLSPTVVGGAESFAILPSEIVLDGPHATQRVVVERLVDGRAAGDVTPQVRWTLADPALAQWNDGVLQPRQDGQTRLQAEVAGQTIEAVLTVRGSTRHEPWSFRHDVQTALTRAGCNMGACHGAQAGKKSFKLALRGYDHELDWNTITRQVKGRRIDLAAPRDSLLLRKGLGELSHGGGSRFDEESLEYRILHEWIAAGAAGPRPEDPVMERLEIVPPLVTLAPGATQQMLVLAPDSDGRRRDVTHWAKYTSTETGVATIDDEGVVTVTGRGEAAITVWFASKVAVATVAVPNTEPVPAEVFAGSPRRNLIDQFVLDKLQRLN
ncbi:MAG: Ig domain-containing protein, partial [Planctomycetaceae bacterium]